MKNTMEKINNRLSDIFSLMFNSWLQRAVVRSRLTHHIVTLNKKSSATEIINGVSDCLKDILGYRLFAFVVQKKTGVDIWLDPRMYKASIEEIIQKDFNLRDTAVLNYMNHKFAPNEYQEKFSLDTLVHYDLEEESYRGRLYIMPEKGITNFHNEVVCIILQGCAAVLSKQIKIENLKDAAVVDPLTGCYNRREFESQLQRHATYAARHGSKLSLIMLDLDHFKTVNDTYGHLGGDQVLREVTRVISQNIRRGDILARYGGEEFIVILPGTGKMKAMALADRLRTRIASLEIPWNDDTIRVTASFGVAQHRQGEDLSGLIETADSMLYKAKINGRNTVMPGLIRVCPAKMATAF